MKNKNTPTLPQQEAYSRISTKVHDATKKVNDAAMKAFKELKALDPELSSYSLNAQCRPYKRTGNSKVVIELADKITYRINQDKTQSELLNEVQTKYPDKKIYASIWQKTLSTPLLKKIKERVKCNGFQSINLNKCNTLSSIRKQILKANMEKQGSYKTSITITESHLYFDNKSYKIEAKKSGGYEYSIIRVQDPNTNKRVSLRVDALLNALKID